MFKQLLTAVTVCALGANALAADVVAKPGELHTLISNPQTETTLTVSGTVNAADLEYIVNSMPALQTLDLGSADIAAFDAAPVAGRAVFGQKHHPANTVPAAGFAGSTIRTVTLPASTASVGDGAFASAAVQTVTLPAACRLGIGVFAGCTSLTSATVGDVPAGTFSNCSALSRVSLPGVTAIAPSAFTDCTALTTVEAPALREIGARAFAGCSSLTKLPVGPALVSIGEKAFAGSGLTRMDLSRSTADVVIGPWAFADCTALADLRLPAGCAVGKGAFFGCKSLRRLFTRDTEDDYQAGVSRLPDYAFTGAVKLDANSILGPQVDSLGRYSLAYTDGTANPFLPPSVAYLGDHAMEGVRNMSALYLSSHDFVPELGQDVWASVNQKDIALKVNPAMADAFMNSPQWSEFNINTVTNVENNTAVDRNSLRGRFTGTDLEIGHDHCELREIALYDLNGMCLTRTVPATGATVTVIPTAAYSTDAYLVVAVLADGTRLSFKLIRQPNRN